MLNNEAVLTSPDQVEIRHSYRTQSLSKPLQATLIEGGRKSLNLANLNTLTLSSHEKHKASDFRKLMIEPLQVQEDDSQSKDSQQHRA